MERIKYTIGSVQQEKLLQLNLDIKDAFILSYLKDTIGTNSKFISKIVNNEIFYWIKYSSLIEYLPILKIENEKVIARRFAEYENLGLIKRHIHKVTNKVTNTFIGSYTFINLTNKFSELFEENKIETDVDELERAAKEMGLTIDSRENFSVPSGEPRELFSSLGKNLEIPLNTEVQEDISAQSRGYSKVLSTDGTQKFSHNTTINNTPINNNTTTKKDSKILEKKESEKSSSSFIDFDFLKKYTGLANSTRLNILNAFPNLSKENFNSAFNIVKEEYKKGTIKSFDAVLVKYLKGEWNIPTSLPGSNKEDDFKFIKACIFDCLQYLQFGWSNKDLIDKLQRDISGKPLELQLKAREMLENELKQRR